jgi:DNA-binding NtrC family response regulator/tetratricopeptide (TPR) repeat protein
MIDFDNVERLLSESKFEDALGILDVHSADLIRPAEYLALKLTALVGLSRWSEALSVASLLLDAALKSGPAESIARIHALLGTTYLRLGHVSEAETHLRASMHLFTWELDRPSEALKPARTLAAMFANMGLWSNARHELKRSLSIADSIKADRESAGLRINLAVLLLKSGAIDDAVRFIDEATVLADNNSLIKQSVLVRLLHSKHARLAGDLRGAFSCLVSLLDQIRSQRYSREEAICLEYLGDCFLAQREYKKAFEHYTQAMEIAEAIAPHGDLIPELCQRLAEALVSLGDANQAILYCERGIRAARETSDRYEECATHRVLAMAHRAAGNPTKAYRVATEGIALGRSYEIPYELARTLAWTGETRLRSKGRDDQMMGRLQLWEARAVFERIGLQNEVRALDRILGFDEEPQPKQERPTLESLTDIPNLDKGALRFGIITTSPELSEAVATIQSVAPSRIPVLITGPSGVGKELLAKALHQMSDRRKMPFIPVNCGSISANLIESELFGHERGAFTGAIASRDGLFTSADRGTIFLDEIGELPSSTQATLLRVLETGELRKVGSDEVRSIDVRVVAATNADLESMVERGLFRSDLYFRLEGVNVRVPALRDREDDIRALFRFFFADSLASSGKKLTVTEDVEPLLCAYAWPGNVRELRHEIVRAVTVAEDGAVLGREALLPKLRTKSPSALREARLQDEATAAERARILQALRAHHGNKADAARSLGGMKRTTLLYKMDRLKIRPEEYQVIEP